MRSCYRRKLAGEDPGITNMDRLKQAARFGQWDVIEDFLSRVADKADARVADAARAVKEAQAQQTKSRAAEKRANSRALKAEGELQKFVDATEPEKVRLAVEAKLKKTRAVIVPDSPPRRDPPPDAPGRTLRRDAILEILKERGYTGETTVGDIIDGGWTTAAAGRIF